MKLWQTPPSWTDICEGVLVFLLSVAWGGGEFTLYMADAIVRVPTLLAFLETQAPLIASVKEGRLAMRGGREDGSAYGSRGKPAKG